MSSFKVSILILFLIIGVKSFGSSGEEFAEAVDALKVKAFVQKEAAASVLADLNNRRIDTILSAFIEGKLYTKKDSGEVVIVSPLKGGGFELEHAATGEYLGVVGRRGAKKISVNNKLRRHLKSLQAVRRLNDNNPAERVAAVSYTHLTLPTKRIV